MLNPLYTAVGWIVVHIHAGLAPVFGAGSGWAWGLSIVLLTAAMRLVLFPLFVRQIRWQRQMQVLQPKMKELQQKHKGDKERLNKEIMALYKEHGANPLTGCLPLLLQFPIFIALFHVLDSLKPKLVHGQYTFTGVKVLGFPNTHIKCGGHLVSLVECASRSKPFGVPIGAAFSSNAHLLQFLNNTSATTVKVVAIVLIVLMGLSTFITQKQLMARTTTTGQTSQQQKILLYVLPFTFFIWGFKFPLGVLLYWLTTNLWSMAQQAVVIRRMGTGAPAAATAGTAGRVPETAMASLAPKPGARPALPSPGPSAGSPAAATTPGAAAPTARTSVSRRPAGNRNRGRNRRGRRR